MTTKSLQLLLLEFIRQILLTSFFFLVCRLQLKQRTCSRARSVRPSVWLLSAEEMVLPSVAGRTQYSFGRVVSREQIFIKFGMNVMLLEPTENSVMRTL